MDMSSAEARDHLRQVIEDEIKALEEHTYASKRRRNALVPISQLPPETLSMIFSFLFPPLCDGKARYRYLPLLRVTHVCHQWRETALNYSCLWSCINPTMLSPTGIAEMLVRAKTAPLHFEARITFLNDEKLDVCERELKAHVSRIRHLGLSGRFQTVLEQLVSPAPSLESLTLLDINPPSFIPNTLFNGNFPKLTSLKLKCCDISWKSPLLKGLRTLQILRPSTGSRPTLEDWLDALNEMPQLETLHLYSSSPVVPVDEPFIPKPRRTVTLPYLTRFKITSSAKSCALALAHLVLPALTSLHVSAESQDKKADDIRLVIPYVTRNAHGPQDMAPLQSILFNGTTRRAEIIAWTVPDADVEVHDPITLLDAAVSARVVFSATSDVSESWRHDADTEVFGAMLTHLPLNAISTLSVHDSIRLSEEFWLHHAPRLDTLKQARLATTAFRAFRKMLELDVPPSLPLRLPQLTKLALVGFPLTALKTYHLRDMLVKRAEQGAPLEVLNLRTCVATERAIQLLAEIVDNVQGPAEMLKRENPAFSDWRGGVGLFDKDDNEDGYPEGYDSWYGSIKWNKDSSVDRGSGWVPHSPCSPGWSSPSLVWSPTSPRYSPTSPVYYGPSPVWTVWPHSSPDFSPTSPVP